MEFEEFYEMMGGNDDFKEWKSFPIPENGIIQTGSGFDIGEYFKKVKLRDSGLFRMWLHHCRGCYEN